MIIRDNRVCCWIFPGYSRPTVRTAEPCMSVFSKKRHGTTPLGLISISVYEMKNIQLSLLTPRWVAHHCVDSWSCRESNASPIHVPILTLFIRLGWPFSVRPQDEDGIQRPISTTGIYLCRKSFRQWPARIRRFHEERRTPRPCCAGYGPCPRHCQECFCRLFGRCFIQLGSPPSA